MLTARKGTMRKIDCLSWCSSWEQTSSCTEKHQDVLQPNMRSKMLNTRQAKMESKMLNRLRSNFLIPRRSKYLFDTHMDPGKDIGTPVRQRPLLKRYMSHGVCYW